MKAAILEDQEGKKSPTEYHRITGKDKCSH